MKRICSWCRKPLGDVQDVSEPSGLTTHGICPSCAETLFSEMGTRVRTLLDKFNVPVVVVNERYEVTGANESARNLLGKTADEFRGRVCGEAFECVHASEDAGCGNTDHCPNCELRAAVTETLQTGHKLHRVPARITRTTPDGPDTLDLVVSTERVGSMVLLKVDKSGAS